MSWRFDDTKKVPRIGYLENSQVLGECRKAGTVNRRLARAVSELKGADTPQMVSSLTPFQILASIRG
jgi:hypothetical protein